MRSRPTKRASTHIIAAAECDSQPVAQCSSFAPEPVVVVAVCISVDAADAL
jgi:hypothetical protein